MNISIYSKSGVEIASVVVGSNSYAFTQIMGENYLQLEFSHSEYIDIRRDAYVTYNGIKYTLIQAVNVEKVSTCEYNYNARFEAPQELLANVIMSHMFGEDQVTTKAYERNFSLAGTATEHLDMMILNLAKLEHVTFSRGTVDNSLTGVKVVGYNVVDCKSALQLIANAFECEWWITGNETNGYAINLGKYSFNENNPTKLAYGFDNGVLSGAKRQLHKDAQRMTHICVQGGSDNINTLSQLTDVDGNPISPYGFSTLHLPRTENMNASGVGNIYYDVKNNKFDGETGFMMDTAVLLTIDRKANTMTSSLFNKNEDVIVERAYDLSEYYPKKTRKVTSFAFQRNYTEFYVTDTTIEDACNYKSYQLGGEKITIVFQTGALAGKSFDVINYDHTSKKFECSLADYDTISMPSKDETMWRPAVNDEFIVYGCALPSTYFADRSTDPYSGAEWDMCRRTASILCENFEDKYAYSLTIDSNWLSRRTQEERNRLKCGFWVHFSDNQLCGGGIDIRITDVKQYLTHPLNPEITIGDEVKTVSVTQKLTQIASNVSATYNYVQSVQQETQQAIQKVEESKVESLQSDWDETDETSLAYIKHKPIIPEGVSVIDNLTSTDTTASLSANQGRVLKGLVDNKASKTHTHAWDDVTNKPIYSSTSVVQHLDWANRKLYLPNVNTLAYWNGAWSADGSSNLQYCYRGKFGTIVTKNIEDFSQAGHTHKISDLTDFVMQYPIATRDVNATTTGWLPIVNITLYVGSSSDTASAVKIMRYRLDANKCDETTILFQMRLYNGTYSVKSISCVSSVNYEYQYGYTQSGSTITIYSYIANDAWIKFRAYAHLYTSLCSYSANSGSVVAEGVTAINASDVVTQVGSVGTLNYSSVNKCQCPTINTLAYWNGQYTSGWSNLQYCDRGRFGTIVTHNEGDYSLSNHSHTWDAITGKPIDTEWGDAGTQSDAHIPSTKLVYDGLNGFVELITNTNTRVNNKADKTELNAYVKTTDLDSNYYNKTSIDLAVGMLQKKNDFINFKLGGSYANWQVSEVEQHGGLSVLDISRSTSGQSNYNLCIGITNRTTITNYNNYLLNHRCVVTCTMFNSDGSVKQVDALGSVSSFKNFFGTCFIWIIFNTNVVDPDFSSDPDAYNYFAVKFEPIN